MKEPVYVIMSKGAVYENTFYMELATARNYIRWKFPKRRWKEPEENKFVCSQYGTTFKIIELNVHPSYK